MRSTQHSSHLAVFAGQAMHDAHFPSISGLSTIDTCTIRHRFEQDHPDWAHLSRAIEPEYRRFLEIKHRHGDTHGLLFAAPPLISSFWQTHALSTELYAAMWDVTGMRIHYDPTLDHEGHPSYAHRLQNTFDKYRYWFGRHPQTVDAVVWFDDGVCSDQLCDLPEALPEYDPDTLYDSDVCDAGQDMNEVWSVYTTSLTGRRLRFRLKRDIMAGQLKYLIQDRDGIPPDQQRLIFGGRQMDNFGYLRSNYGLEDGSVVHEVLRLRGC